MARSIRPDTRPRPASSGRPPPRPGTAGSRRWKSGWARRRSECWTRAGVAAGKPCARRCGGRRRPEPAAADAPARRPSCRHRHLARDPAYAAQSAAQAGLRHRDPRTRRRGLDDAAAGSFDAVISRLGLIYFPDQQRALSGMARALRDGGRIGVIVYSTAERNEFFSMPVRIIRRAAGLAAAGSRVSRGRSAWARQGVEGVLEEPVFATSACKPSRAAALPSAANACASSANRSAPCTR